MTSSGATAPRSTRPLAVCDATGVFVGYASLFNKRDQAGDIVMPGAFKESLRQRGAQGIRMLFQHNPAEPVGTWIDIEEDGKGLQVRGRLTRLIHAKKPDFCVISAILRASHGPVDRVD